MYKNLKILNPKEHSFYRYTPSTEFFFAKDINLIPITYSETKMISCNHPIVIIDQDDKPMLVMLAGVEKNDLVDNLGKWQGDYIPAFLRRYPFALIKTKEDDETLQIGFDLDSGCFTSPTGSLLFDDDQPSKTLLEIKTLLEAYQQESTTTEMILSLLKERGILTPSQVTIVGSDGEPKIVDGFMAIDRAKLLEQDDEFILQATKGGWMEMIELHLLSIR